MSEEEPMGDYFAYQIEPTLTKDGKTAIIVFVRKRKGMEEGPFTIETDRRTIEIFGRKLAELLNQFPAES